MNLRIRKSNGDLRNCGIYFYYFLKRQDDVCINSKLLAVIPAINLGFVFNTRCTARL